MKFEKDPELKHYRRVIKTGFRDEVHKILKGKNVDIDATFLGFLDIYEHLSKIIPKERTILDFGCAYGIQAIYFLKHKKYVGIDISSCQKLKTPNSIYHKMIIKEFIKRHKDKYQNVFAICSYVPSEEVNLVRENFSDLFIYYVSNDDIKL